MLAAFDDDEEDSDDNSDVCFNCNGLGIVGGIDGQKDAPCPFCDPDKED